MRRFKFGTGTGPEEAGEGVQFTDGLVSYRERLGAYWTNTFQGRIGEIYEHYGGQQGFKFTGSTKRSRP